MRNPERKFVLALVGLGIAGLLLWATLSGRLGPDTTTPATVAGVAGVLVLLVAGYFAISGAISAIGVARLKAGVGVIARWRVPSATWKRFRDIDIEETGVRVPALRGLLFRPRTVASGETVEIICGKRSVLIDGCYFPVAPGRGAGMEEQAWC